MLSSRVTLTILFDRPPGSELDHKLFHDFRSLGAIKNESMGGSKWELVFDNTAAGKYRLAELARQTANKYGIMLKWLFLWDYYEWIF